MSDERKSEPNPVTRPMYHGQSRALHLWNEMMRREPDFDKNKRFAPSSLFEQLCRRYLDDGVATI